jgi:hypothetical protein
MYDSDIDDERMFVLDSARKHNKGSKDEIQLYEQLSLALELIQDDSFKVIGSRICNGIDFNITTEYPNGLPEKIGSMFFNIDSDYDVRVCETPLYTNGVHRDPGEMNFSVKIKKY